MRVLAINLQCFLSFNNCCYFSDLVCYCLELLIKYVHRSIIHFKLGPVLCYQPITDIICCQFNFSCPFFTSLYLQNQETEFYMIFCQKDCQFIFALGFLSQLNRTLALVTLSPVFIRGYRVQNRNKSLNVVYHVCCFVCFLSSQMMPWFHYSFQIVFF